jgi:hypothetical protein
VPQRAGAAACALPTPRVRTCRLLLAPTLLLGAAFARGQDGADAAPHWPVRDLPSHLAADDPGKVAWAAYLVLRDRVRAAIPAVRQALARLSTDATIESEIARLELLDTLIQLDVRLPGEELLPHAARGMLRVPALILAAKSPEANSAYFATRMAALDKTPDLEWRVCGNLLAAQRDPRFIARCVRQLEFAIDITVRDDKQPMGGPSG